MNKLFCWMALASGLSVGPLAAQPAPLLAVTAGELLTEPPTLIALGFEWYVQGDDNGNATVSVAYRKKNERAWRPALPFLRFNRVDIVGPDGERVPPSERPNLLAGSIMDLDPDTDYEVRLILSDSDGASGQTNRRVTARTRAEPKAAEGGRVFHVYPPDWKGTVQPPAFIGLPAAYWKSNAVAADAFNTFPPRVQPGDVILVHAGLYKDNWHYYGMSSTAVPPSGQIPPHATCCGATFHGTYFLNADGTPDKPIVIKAAGDGEAIFDGDGNDTLFNVAAADYTYFEGLTFRNSKIAVQAGWRGIAGAVGLTVRRSRFENVGQGIHAEWGGSRDFYIADNIFLGRHAPDKLVPWGYGIASPRTAQLQKLGIVIEDMRLQSEYAVKVRGSGHVMAFNRAENFHDGFDLATYGAPDGWPHTPRDRMPVANDFYNNVFSNMHDDCIEVDGGLYNIRVLRNLCINSAGSAISTQPGAAGPYYLLRNIAYHIPGNFAAIKNVQGRGILAYNNTFLVQLRSSGSQLQSDFRNNLIMAEFPEEAAYAYAFTEGSPTSDYNGFMAGRSAEALFVRRAPGPPAVALKEPPSSTMYPSLAAYVKATGQDRHSRMVDYRIFRNLQPPDPEAITRVYDPDRLDFQLKPRSAAVDAGMTLPNVTDGYRGRAPDLGALEVGAPIPHYGPR